MKGRVLSPGDAAGRALVLSEPISLWGGLDPATGEIVEPRHPQRGVSVAGRVLVMPAARGSSSSASVLVEAVRAGVAPTAILLGDPDLILAVGAAVAEELYGIRLPVAVLEPHDLAAIVDGEHLVVRSDGEIVPVRAGP